MVAVFKSIGVSKAQLESKYQRNIESIQPAQFVALQRIYNSIKDGMSSPADWFEPEETAKETTADTIKKLLKKPAEEKTVPVKESESVPDSSPEPVTPETVSEAMTYPDPGKPVALRTMFDDFQARIIQTKIRGRLKNLLEQIKTESTTGELTEEQVCILLKMIDVRDGELKEEQGK